MKSILTAGWVALVPGAVLAHPDHLSGGSVGWTHYVTDPFHVSLLALAVLAFVGLRRGVRQMATAKQRIR